MNFGGVGTHPQSLKPLRYEQITVGTAVKQLNPPANAKRAILDVESQSIRCCDDGTDPTTNAGHLVKADVHFEIIGTAAIKAFKAIRATGSDGTLNVSYYG